MLRKISINLSLIFTSIFVGLLIIEIVLRIAGHGPWSEFKIDKKEPVINMYDKNLGWIPKPGNYKFLPYSDEGLEFKFTIQEDGSRITNNKKDFKNNRKKILLVGGSFTQGVAVGDMDTFAYKLQEKITNHEIINFGVGGYGTYQSYLLLKKVLKKNNNYNHIIYFFISDHIGRNSGNEFWLRTLSKYSKRNTIYLPYARLASDGHLKEMKPIKYINLPFRDKLVIVHKIEKRIMKLKLFSVGLNEEKIFFTIINKINELVLKNNAKFTFVDLSSGDNLKNRLENFLSNNDILYINCDLKLDSSFMVKNEGHPNPKAHSLFSECIYRELKKSL